MVIASFLLLSGETDHNERGLYVDKATIEYFFFSGDSYVNTIVWVTNEGGSSQDVTGCQLKTALFYEGVLMDEKVVDLNGLLEPLSSTLYQVEFHSVGGVLSFGEEARVRVTLVDSDGTVLDTDDYRYTMS